MKKKGNSILMGFILSIGISLQLANLKTLDGFLTDSYGNGFLGTTVRGILSVSKGIPQIQLVLLCVLISFFIWHYHKTIFQNQKPLIWMLSLIYSFCSTVGIAFRATGDLSLFSNSFIGTLSGIYFFVSLAFLLSMMLHVLLSLLQSIRLDDSNSEKHRKASFLQLWIFLMLCWLFYIFVMAPGVMNWDTLTQLRYYYGMPSNNLYRASEYLIQGSTSTLSDHHPFILTVIYGAITQLGAKLGNVNYGIFLLTTIQFIFSTFVFAKLLYVLKSFHINQKIYNSLLIFTAFFPLLPIISMYIVKNSVYCMSLLWFSTLLLEFVSNKSVTKKKAWIVSLVVSVIFQVLFVKYGIHVILISGVIFLFALKDFRKKTFLLILLPAILLHIGWSKVLLPSINVIPGDPVESYSVFFQQTARYIKTFPEDVTDNQKDVLEKLFVYEKIADNYNPELSDPIKGRFVYKYDTVQPKDLSNYRKVWLEMFMKHPGVYFEATLHNMYGYFDLNKEKLPENITANGVAVIATQENDVNYKGHDVHFRIKDSDWNKKLKKIVGKIIVLLARLPIISLLFKGNTYIFLCLVSAAFLLIQKKWKLFAITVPYLVQVLICIASPVNDNQRYMYPFIWGGILFIALLALSSRETNTSQIIKNRLLDDSLLDSAAESKRSKM
ncbi:DUF6020 family protein [Enterococcus sp.]|uniref:DUF6020 family protein n=1 Tax=Enterococcus sp. TaxID=35783 RepID=UPI003C71437F